MCSAILFLGQWWCLAGSRETIIVPFNPARWRREPKVLVQLKICLENHTADSRNIYNKTLTIVIQWVYVE